jgi:hypothetical protein
MYVKGHFSGASPVRSSLQTVLIGGLATAAAFAIARAISRLGHAALEHWCNRSSRAIPPQTRFTRRPEREAQMGQTKGDKARYKRQRRKKLARREKMRALRATLGAEAAAAPQPKAGATTKISSKTSASLPSA